MIAIYKKAIEIVDKQVVMLPYDSEILSFQIQDGVPTIWFLCNSTHYEVTHTFEIFGTGQTIEDYLAHRKFIGTVQLIGVWHLFLRLSPL